jgi:hydrogenase maturation protease
MKKALLIGVGNTVRGDDGAGIHAAEKARARFPHLDVLAVHGLSPELAETVSGYDLVIIVDASLVTDTLRASEIVPSTAERIQSHEMSPAGILGLAATLYNHRPSRAVLLEIPAVSCAFTEELSALTAGQVEACLEVVAGYLVPFQPDL